MNKIKYLNLKYLHILLTFSMKFLPFNFLKFLPKVKILSKITLTQPLPPHISPPKKVFKNISSGAYFQGFTVFNEI